MGEENAWIKPRKIENDKGEMTERAGDYQKYGKTVQCNPRPLFFKYPVQFLTQQRLVLRFHLVAAISS